MARYSAPLAAAGFYWVVGCSYRGLPVSVDPVRNPIGASMSLQTALTLKVGGFDSMVGRVGTRPTGCEETELAIRLTAAKSASIILYVPGAVVSHHVGQERLKLGSFLRRCWHEGVWNAGVVQLAGASAGLESERRYVAAILPAASPVYVVYWFSSCCTPQRSGSSAAAPTSSRSLKDEVR